MRGLGRGREREVPGRVESALERGQQGGLGGSGSRAAGLGSGRGFPRDWSSRACADVGEGSLLLVVVVVSVLLEEVEVVEVKRLSGVNAD